MKVYESQKVKSLVNEVFDEAENYGWYKAMAHLQRRMTDIPEIDAEPVRHGHWIKVGCSFYGVSRYECSVCHYTDEHNESREVPYCWQCGARMENDDNM